MLIGVASKRLERARLLLAHDGVRRQRHGSGNRRQEEQHEELLKQEQLDTGIRLEPCARIDDRAEADEV